MILTGHGRRTASWLIDVVFAALILCALAGLLEWAWR
jgi:hypothetical protein